MLSKKKYILTSLLILLFLLPTLAQGYKAPKNYGGKKEFQRLFKQEFVFPPKALEEKVSGTVVLRFIVRTSGQTDELSISQELHPDVEAECTRIFNMLLWEPAEYYGKARDEFVDLEFKVNHKQYGKLCKRRGYSQPPENYSPASENLNVVAEKDCDKAAYPIIEEIPFALEKYIRANLKYPPAAKSQSISGSSIIGFVVEPNGLLSNLQVVKDLGGGCNEETQRLLLGLEWKPGMKNGEYVRSYKEFQVIYKLPNNNGPDYVPIDNNVQ